MARTRNDFRVEIKRLIRDGAGILTPPDVEALIDRGLEVYNRKSPRTVVVDLESDGSGDFATASLTGFDEEFSGDPVIESPISTSGEPNNLDRREWDFYRKPGGLVIRLASAISAGEDVRFTFKAPHSITDLAATTTIPTRDFYAYCKLAAAEGCDDLARHFTETSENAFGNETIANYQSKPREYETRAKNLRQQANEHLGEGKDGTGPKAASVTKNWDTTSSLGSDRLTHPRRRR
jgi:hypothetical protein